MTKFPLVEAPGLRRFSSVLVSCTQNPCSLDLSVEKRVANVAKPQPSTYPGSLVFLLKEAGKRSR